MVSSIPAVLLIVFNRPEETRRVFAEIRLARPRQLYLACDGPRSSKIGEAELVEKVRRLVSQVDWPCEVKTRFLEENLGCGRAVSSAIEWFLNDAGEGIILEDDCLPTPAFFHFCSVMLERYRHDERVGVIAGSNMAPEVKLDHDYGFSRLIACWGWATWRRTWSRYQLIPDSISMDESWTDLYDAKSFNALQSSLNRISGGEIHTWDYQLLVQQLRLKQLTVIPSKNLVLNIGFSGTGTHFSNSGRPWWAPRFAYNSNYSWSQEIVVKPSEIFDLYYQASAHGGGEKVFQKWVKFTRSIYFWFERILKNPYFKD